MKKERHAKIYEIIEKQDIETQEELAARLQEAGFQVTQATVSRDIRELKLTKAVAETGKQRYVTSQGNRTDVDNRYLRILKDGYVSMDMAQNILVIKTGAGLAMAVAAALDALDWWEIVGCIAGDDTIMCAIRSTEDTGKVMSKIQKIVQE